MMVLVCPITVAPLVGMVAKYPRLVVDEEGDGAGKAAGGAVQAGLLDRIGCY